MIPASMVALAEGVSACEGPAPLGRRGLRAFRGSAPLGGAWRSVSGVLRLIPLGSWIAKPSSNPSPALFALFFLPLSTASLFLAFRMRRSAVGTTRLLYMLTTCMLKEYRCY